MLYGIYDLSEHSTGERTTDYGVLLYFIRRVQELPPMQGPMTEHGRFQGSEWWQVDHAGSLTIGTLVHNL